VHDRELRCFRRAIRADPYEFTYHGLDEMEQDRLTVLDVESCVLTGLIVERQRDRRTWEWKYVIEGRAADAREIAVVVKALAEGKMLLLTVYTV